MASDDETRSSAEKMKIDEPPEHDTVQDINTQFPKIDNLEYFPENVLFHIFSKVNDNDLLHLSDTSCRFEKIARAVFKEKYADKYFVFDDDKKQEMYEELFSRFGHAADIKAVEVKKIWDINDDHWLAQLLRQYTTNLQQLTFNGCWFKEINNILSDHMSVKHLVLRDITGIHDAFKLPEYRNLKKLELVDVRRYRFVNLAQTIQNNPTLESLILSHSESTFQNMMKTIAKNSMCLQHLTELHLQDFRVDNSRISPHDMNSIVDALKNLQSLKLFITDSQLELIQRLSSTCKQLKCLTLHNFDKRNGNFNDALIDAIGRFISIEKLKLVQSVYNDRIESVVAHMPNLRHLYLHIMKIPNSSSFVLSLLRNCPSIKTIEIDARSSDIKTNFFVNEQFWNEFKELMQHPNGKIELKTDKKRKSHITKQEITWNNMAMKWPRCDFNDSNVTLLDLAAPSVESVGAKAEEKKPSPYEHILGYLDLASLYSMSTVCEQSKQLVEDFVKRHAERNGTFTISDQFHHDAERLDAFAKNVENLHTEFFYTDSNNLLNTIQKRFTNLKYLNVTSRWPQYAEGEIRAKFHHIKHKIFETYEC